MPAVSIGVSPIQLERSNDADWRAGFETDARAREGGNRHFFGEQRRLGKREGYDRLLDRFDAEGSPFETLNDYS